MGTSSTKDTSTSGKWSSAVYVGRVVLCQLFADDLVFHALSSKRGSAPSSRTPHRLSRLNEAEALHRQDVAYCGEMGCVIALQEHTPQCQILPLSRSGAQDVLRLLAEWRALLRGYCTSRSGKSSETLQPEQLVDLEFSVVLPQAPKVLPLPGFRLLLSRILLMCLAALQLVVSKGPGQRRNADRGSPFFFFEMWLAVSFQWLGVARRGCFGRRVAPRLFLPSLPVADILQHSRV